MLSILNRALSWAITSFGNKFNLKKRSRLIKALDNGFYVKFMQLEIGLLDIIVIMVCLLSLWIKLSISDRAMLGPSMPTLRMAARLSVKIVKL